MKKKKLVILGGTFDPVHNGHIYSAQAVYEQLQPEKILFIPAFIAPHKVGQDCAPAADRYAMTVLATEAYPYFEVSDMELRRSGISYTLDTVRELGRLYPEHELYFLIGADTIPQLQTWHKIDELLQLVIFVAAKRPGYKQVLDRACVNLGDIAREKILLVDTPEYEVSSTEIRQKIKAGEKLQGLVPARVEEYIREHQLYLFTNEEHGYAED